MNEPVTPDAREIVRNALSKPPRRDAALATLAAIAVELRVDGYENGKLAEAKVGVSDSAISRARIRIVENGLKRKRLAILKAGTH